MANMHFSASIYQVTGPGGTTDILTTYGRLNSFPSVGTLIFPTTTTTAIGVVCNSVIRVFPFGLNQKPTDYYTPTDVATLNTAAT